MPLIKNISHLLASGLVCLLLLTPLINAHAQIVNTDTLLAQMQSDTARSALLIKLQREEIKEQLVLLGVDPKNAIARVQNLSSEEVLTLNKQIDDLPVGSGANLLGAALFIFTLFVITDVIGATDIFPFIRPATR